MTELDTVIRATEAAGTPVAAVIAFQAGTQICKAGVPAKLLLSRL
ncbi:MULTISPECIES: hypothetical protein [unclassified Pseudofrankia]|nr:MULTISPECIES: hypothetical protein [unclassified Pseudofrankia]MDT3445883.1 hypothetical protein [Pseudofrankia sp. BMG5.37]